MTTENNLVDVHAHLCDSTYDGDLDEVLKRAGAAGVAGIVAVGENIADARRNLALAVTWPMVQAAAGLYPTYLDTDQTAPPVVPASGER